MIIEKAKERILTVFEQKEFFDYGLLNMVLIATFELTNKVDIKFPHYYTITRTINSVLGKESGSRRGVKPVVKVESGGFEQDDIEKEIRQNKVMFLGGKSPLPTQEIFNSYQKGKGFTINQATTVSYLETALLFLEIEENMKEYGVSPEQTKTLLCKAISKSEKIPFIEDLENIPENILSEYSDIKNIYEEKLKAYQTKLDDLVDQKYLAYSDKDNYLENPTNEQNNIRKEAELGYLTYLRKKSLLETNKSN